MSLVGLTTSAPAASARDWTASGRVRIDAEEAELDAEASWLRGEAWVPRHAIVGVIGVEHELDAERLEGGEVRVGVVHRDGQHLAVEGEGALHVAHDQVDGERR